ncbi:MAG: hypothetical protein HOM54_00810 [Actinobacteria bacterium]|jgi:hypothetical protein|nr:hypothetical protein [Actinomycetota bacterium]MBT7692766.1 hypothetical protein [Gemmatimonadales bacterium]
MSTDEQAFEDEWEEEVETQPPDRCPACGGSRFGVYVMGMPMTGGDFFEQLDRDEIRLLGCIPPDTAPFWFCRDCDADILEEGWLAPNEEVASELERLNELLYDDALDYDEFQAARKRLLDPGTPS